MRDINNQNADASQADSVKDNIGDVETAGEPTAVAAITGPVNSKPVGADTMIPVADAPDATAERK